MKAYRLRWLAVPVLFILVAVSAAWCPWRTSLLDRSTPVANMRGWGGVVWLSPRAFLLLRNPNDPNVKILYANLATGVKTRMPGLETALRRFHQEGLLPSPDGKWLLCVPFDGEPEAHAVTLDGKHVLEWKASGSTQVAWIPSTTRWLDLIPPADSSSAIQVVSRARVFDVERPTWGEELSVEPPLSGPQGAYGMPIVAQPEGNLLIGCADDSNGTGNGWTVLLSECAARPDRVVRLQTRTGRTEIMPSDGSLAISPHQDRVAWIADDEELSPWQRLLHRLLPRYDPPARHISQLCTARLDGTQKRILGSMEERDGLGDVHWLPDGSRLSFKCRDKLWLLPANRL